MLLVCSFSYLISSIRSLLPGVLGSIPARSFTIIPGPDAGAGAANTNTKPSLSKHTLDNRFRSALRQCCWQCTAIEWRCMCYVSRVVVTHPYAPALIGNRILEWHLLIAASRPPTSTHYDPTIWTQNTVTTTQRNDGLRNQPHERCGDEPMCVCVCVCVSEATRTNNQVASVDRFACSLYLYLSHPSASIKFCCCFTVSWSVAIIASRTRSISAICGAIFDAINTRSSSSTARNTTIHTSTCTILRHTGTGQGQIVVRWCRERECIKQYRSLWLVWDCMVDRVHIYICVITLMGFCAYVSQALLYCRNPQAAAVSQLLYCVRNLFGVWCHL